MREVVADHFGFLADGVTHALLESRQSKQWRAILVQTLINGLDLPEALSADLLARFVPDVHRRDVERFLRITGEALRGVGVSMTSFRLLLWIFWHLPHGSWSPAIQAPPPELAIYRSHCLGLYVVRFIRRDGRTVDFPHPPKPTIKKETA